MAALQAQVTDCRRCPRLVAWRERVAREKRASFRDHVYWGRPVPAFGDADARVLVVGLALLVLVALCGSLLFSIFLL